MTLFTNDGGQSSSNDNSNNSALNGVQLVVVHGGGAHADDALAVGFALALGVPNESPVVRREPAEDELADPRVLVLDVGERYEPTLGNYDHHQFPRDAAPRCAAQLLLESYAPNAAQALAEHTAWYPLLAELDVRGPFAVARDHGTDTQLVFGLAGALHSPLTSLLEEFEGDDQPLSQELRWVLRKLGESHLRYAQELLEAQRDVREHASIEMLAGVPVVTYTRDVRFGGLVGIINAWAASQLSGLNDHAALVILKDDRGEGLTALRLEDDPRVDMAGVTGDLVGFAHQGGFISKWGTTEVAVVTRELVAQGAISAGSPGEDADA